MMHADKGLTLFSLMNDMRDSLILESDIGVASVTPKRERMGRFSAFMNHPAMVAVLCAVVSFGVVAAIVMAGRGGPVKPPVGTPPVEETVTQEPFDSESETSGLFETNFTESVYACTLVAKQTVYSVNANYIKTTIVAAEPGKTWEGNGMSYRLCRLEGDREIEVYSYAVEPWGESYPTGPDDYATLPLWCNLTEVRRVLSEKGETLTAGKYRMYYLADTYLGIECPYVDVELVDPSELPAECEAEAYVCGFAASGVLVRIEDIGNVLVHDSMAEEKWAVGDVLRIKYNQRDMDQNGGTLIDKTQWDTPFVYEWRLTDFVEITVVSSETSNE